MWDLDRGVPVLAGWGEFRRIAQTGKKSLTMADFSGQISLSRHKY
jgi:hypothetical protein